MISAGDRLLPKCEVVTCEQLANIDIFNFDLTCDVIRYIEANEFMSGTGIK